MPNENILDKLQTDEKEEFKKSLESLIERTFDIEREYKQLNTSYTSLQNVIYHIVESQPNAVWILDDEENIFLQNSESKKIPKLIEFINLKNSNQEIEFENEIYLVKINHFDQKTVITATDITQEKRSERLTSMGQIAAHLAHEIRNPIGSIALLSSTLLKRVESRQKPIVLEIQKAIYRVERIIKSTLLFTKGVQIHRTKVPLLSLKKEILNAYDNYSISKDITLTIEFSQQQI